MASGSIFICLKTLALKRTAFNCVVILILFLKTLLETSECTVVFPWYCSNSNDYPLKCWWFI